MPYLGIQSWIVAQDPTMETQCADSWAKPFASSLEPLPKEKIKEQAEINLKETEEIKNSCLTELKKLIKEHKVRCIIDDDFLLRFLRAKKFDVQTSFKVIQNYAKQRANLHGLFISLKPESLRICLRQAVFGILPYRDPEGRTICFIRAGIWRPHMCSDMEMVLSMLIFMSYVINDESSQVNGVITLEDERFNRLSDLPVALRHISLIRNFLLNSLPGRYRCHHIINEPYSFKIFRALVVPLFPEKIRRRMLFHGEDREVLFQHIPSSILPIQFGGNLDCSLDNDKFILNMMDYLQKFKEEQQYFIDKE